jgi:hypothetical protein
MGISIMNLFWLMLVQSMVIGLLILAAVLLGGVLVFRTKREQHERMFSPKPVTRKVGPIHRDSVASDVEVDADPISEIVMKQNERFAAALAKDKIVGGITK